jgi:hypothetical protein
MSKPRVSAFRLRIAIWGGLLLSLVAVSPLVLPFFQEDPGDYPGRAQYLRYLSSLSWFRLYGERRGIDVAYGAGCLWDYTIATLAGATYAMIDSGAQAIDVVVGSMAPQRLEPPAPSDSGLATPSVHDRVLTVLDTVENFRTGRYLDCRRLHGMMSDAYSFSPEGSNQTGGSPLWPVIVR